MAVNLPATTSLKERAELLMNTLESDLGGKWRPGPMPTVTSSLKQGTLAVKARAENLLTKGESKVIGGHIELLLRHYYLDQKVSAAVMTGMQLQWLKCLERFPDWAVEEAITEWLENDKKNRRPVPGQIVDLAVKRVSKYHALIARCNQIMKAPLDEERQPPTEAEKAAVSEIVAETVRNLRA